MQNSGQYKKTGKKRQSKARTRILLQKQTLNPTTSNRNTR